MNSKGLSVFGLTMLALGTVVGGSFFLGSAIPINSSGPAVILAYILGGALVYLILFALSEMTVHDPTPGSFRTYAERAYGAGLGFVVGWVYWTGLVLAMSSEAVAVSILLKVWLPKIPIPITGAFIITVITIMNLFGAEKLSKLESSLAAIKLLAIIGFIILAILLIIGIGFDNPAIGKGALVDEPFLPNGLKGIAGSMLIVIFTYAGFEIIGLAASETSNPHRDVPRAIRFTVLGLVGLYTVSIMFLLPLIPTDQLTEDISPFVAALQVNGVDWAANLINIILISAILSTMLAATFGLGRMLKSLCDEGYGPRWLKERKNTPYKGIIFSGLAMLVFFGLSFLLPKEVYLFLVSSGGFSLLFTYIVIIISHYKFRKKNGCPPSGKCQLPGYPYTSWFALIFLIVIIASMPLVPGQGKGLIAGIVLLLLYWVIYFLNNLKTKNK
ncbi:amino acid permease [Clostridium sp. D2Q-11]|uniref:Amino acid permease n=1 Tax=Anaeromonas frigoriresistens TaxID=2683708 RepID=A0A942UU33_9FIRM|nr:amino acid permease [Anaeromonas frigoriresistens]MBS4537475.1 amino acid permease [Anaeromonas frigoriresistens]